MTPGETLSAAGAERRTRELPPPGRERRRGDRPQPRSLAPPPRDSRDTVVEFRGVSKLYGPGGIGLERATLPDILRLTGLSTKLHNYPHQLSGGEQQRVAVARAFASHPPLLLADEPTGNLDPETSIGIMQLLYRINRAGTTVIVASHDNEMVDRMRRRVIELKRGRIVRDEASGFYGAREENTDELGVRLKREAT